MKNATLTVTLLALLAAFGAVAASPARAQTDTDDPAEDPAGDPAEDPAVDPVVDPVVDPAVDPAGDPPAEGSIDAADGDGVDDGSDEVTPSEVEPSEGEGETSDADGVEATTTGTELSAPAEDETAETTAETAPAEAEEPPAPEPLPWRNTFLTWTNQVTFNSFLRNAQLSYNPSYQQSLTLNPRWYVGPATFFWASATLSLELTDADGEARNREPQIADTFIDLRHVIQWEGFIIIPAARLTIPTSRSSLAAQRYLQVGGALTAVRVVPEIGLTIAGLFSYRRWFAGSNMVQVGEPQPDRCPRPPPPAANAGEVAPEINTVTCDQLGDTSSASDVLLYGLSLTWNPPGFAEFNVSLSAFLFTTHGYALAPAYIDVATRDEPLQIDDGSPSHWNNFTYFALSVGYQFTSWMNLSLGIQNSGVVASAYNPDGSIRNPLFTPDTQVFLTATLQLDDIYTNLAGSGDDGLTPEMRQRRRQGLASTPSTGGTF